jgi:hypothetical protein
LRCSDVECGSDTSSDSDDDDDEKSNKIKSLAGIAINKKPSIFNTPSSCFMAKDPKVQYDESDSGSDIEDVEPSKEELIELLQGLIISKTRRGKNSSCVKDTKLLSKPLMSI